MRKLAIAGLLVVSAFMAVGEDAGRAKTPKGELVGPPGEEAAKDGPQQTSAPSPVISESAAWGQAVDGIACRLIVNADYCQGEPLSATIQLKNVSSEKKYLVSIFTPEFGQFVKLDISGAAGKPKLRSGNAQRSIGPDTFVPLKPNQIRQIDLPDLHDYYYSGLDKEGSFRLSYAYTGRKPPRDQVLVAPSGVIARQSTDVAAVSDPELHEVLRFIREHLGEPFSIDELLRAVSVSRRWLEYHFRERFGRSPHAYVSERRVERAKGLLLAPRSPPLEQIAEACGFSTVRSLAETFRRVTGMTPVEFQSANRAGK